MPQKEASFSASESEISSHGGTFQNAISNAINGPVTTKRSDDQMSSKSGLSTSSLKSEKRTESREGRASKIERRIEFADDIENGDKPGDANLQSNLENGTSEDNECSEFADEETIRRLSRSNTDNENGRKEANELSRETQRDKNDNVRPSSKQGIENGEISENTAVSSSKPASETKSVVTIVDPNDAKSKTVVPPTPVKKRPTSSRLRMEKELARMAEADENARLRMKAQRKEEVAAAMLEYEKRKLAEGVTLTPHVAESRTAVRMMVRDEERMALEKVSKKFTSLCVLSLFFPDRQLIGKAVVCTDRKPL